MLFTFHNVEITVEANSATSAYDKLCEALAVCDDIDYTTDTYTTENAPEDERDTNELFGD